MEFAQLESRIAFLDSEYRREKADLAQLRHQLDLSESQKEEMQKRIDALEAELLEQRSESQRLTAMEQQIERFKAEVLKMLDSEKSKQRQSLKEVERSRDVEIESHTRAINEIRREVERSRDIDELITLARTETERQAAILVGFRQRMEALARQNDEQLRSISYLEEQRRTDAKKVTELRAETADLYKRINLQLSKVELLEQQIPQFGKFQLALEENREKVKAEVERTQYQLAQVERKLKSWDTLAETVTTRLAEFESRLERYAQHYQLNTKSLETLQGFQEHLQREQHEFIELQRLAADRLQAKMTEWEDVQDRAVRKQSLGIEQKLNEITKEVSKFQNPFPDIFKRLEDQQGQLTLLLRIAEEDVISRSIAAKEWQARFEQLATED